MAVAYFQAEFIPVLYYSDLISAYEHYWMMALNLHEICRLCLEEIKEPSTVLKEGSSLLTKIRRFLPVVKVSYIKLYTVKF
jgi:hypothetical protein